MTDTIESSNTSYNLESNHEDANVPLFHEGVKTNPNPNQKFKTKQRTLVFSQRKIKPNIRHLMNNIRDMLPHAKGCEKHDTSRHDSLDYVNDLCMALNCSNTIFFQQVGTQAFMYMAKSPTGPTIKFRLHNISTMQELRMTGNCLKGSRPLLHFDKQFDSSPKWKLLKEMYTQMFSTPFKHPKSKPFVDHVFGFYIAEDKVWFRNYQVLMRQQKQGQNYELVETEDGDVVGPGKLVTLSIDGDEPETYYLGSREEKFAGAATMTPESALGQAILGRGINETAEYETPNGSKLSVTIISVELP